MITKQLKIRGYSATKVPEDQVLQRIIIGRYFYYLGYIVTRLLTLYYRTTYPDKRVKYAIKERHRGVGVYHFKIYDNNIYPQTIPLPQESHKYDSAQTLSTIA